MVAERRQRDPQADAAIGARIRAARSTAGLTLCDLAAAVGVSAPQIANYETGRIAVRASMLRAMAAALGVPPGILIEEDHLALPAGLIDERRAVAMVGLRLARIRDPVALRRVMSMIDVLAEALAGA